MREGIERVPAAALQLGDKVGSGEVVAGTYCGIHTPEGPRHSGRPARAQDGLLGPLHADWSGAGDVTGDEFREIRIKLGMNHVEFARALGYNGSDRNNAMLIKRIERGAAPVMPDRALKAIELERSC